MKKVQKGFTLIELMIVVAIIGILAAIAIPAYTDYITRSKWADTISSVASVKTGVAECMDNNGGLGDNCLTTADLAEYGVDPDITTDGTNDVISKYGATLTLAAPAQGSGAVAIEINGNGVAELGTENCVFHLTPTYISDTYLEWLPVETTAQTACFKYVKGASDGAAL